MSYPKPRRISIENTVAHLNLPDTKSLFRLRAACKRGALPCTFPALGPGGFLLSEVEVFKKIWAQSSHRPATLNPPIRCRLIDEPILIEEVAIVDKSKRHSVPTIYLAGKIGKNDWRHDLAPRLRHQTWNDGPIETDSFFYVGPFFVSCDHGCGHSPGEHGMAQGCTDLIYTREEVINLNMAALANTDLVFAYITAPDCHGTLMEIGWAIANGKRVVMAFAPEISVDDFWFSSMQCASVHHDVRPCLP